MSLPLKTDYPPMEAQSALKIPEGDEWQYEPKWDGFRCLAFRDGSQVEIQSKSGQSLGRYFPEVVEAILALEAKKFVLDGEIIVPVGKQLSFDDLLQRIHPAASRIAKLSKETPAQLVVFDLLVDEHGSPLVAEPLHVRRKKLDDFAAKFFQGGIQLSPATPKFSVAKKWFETLGGGLDGIIAKKVNLPYQSGERTGMLKIKNLRTADCVIGGFRYASKGKVAGSLLLGLYDDQGLLHHVGFTSGLSAAERPALTKRLEALIQPPGFTGRAPGGPSRWSTARSEEWNPLKPELVVEVQYDHFTGGRFRHGTKLLRWRPDKKPKQCTMAQVERDTRSPLGLLASQLQSEAW
ncbi:MAG TPA: ATP-dependent DNA ligase [Bryobacteraceae bacterium]|nr:ATP-dependent DNA ligase [Bryobacteraceae bacterium]